ncbi:hypothetical protein TNCV_640521 [Trichonephila clavipes]|nr:hypothetical protein TNCV_640521 [Trichonephila clavipes]
MSMEERKSPSNNAMGSSGGGEVILKMSIRSSDFGKAKEKSISSSDSPYNCRAMQPISKRDAGVMRKEEKARTQRRAKRWSGSRPDERWVLEVLNLKRKGRKIYNSSDSPYNAGP